MVNINSWRSFPKDERLQYIIRSQFRSGNEESIITIIKNEDDHFILMKLLERLVNLDDFYMAEDLDLEPFIRLTREISDLKKQIVWDIILGVTTKAIYDVRKALIIEELSKLPDNLMKARALDYDNTNRIFNHIARKKVFGGKDEILLFEITATNTEEVIKETLRVLTVERPNMGIYRKLINLLDNLAERIEGNEIDRIDQESFLRDFLNLYEGFKDKDELIDLYKNFIDVENLLFVSIGKYRNHVSHSLRVFLLGLTILAVTENLTFSAWSDEEARLKLLCWVFTALFHDIGYSIEEISGMTKKIEDPLKGLGTVQTASFTLADSTRIFAEKIIKEMNDWMQPESEEYEFLPLAPLLKSLDEKKHGLMSGIIFLKELDKIIIKDRNFSKLYGKENIWNHYFLKAAVAMAIHTFPKMDNRGLDLEGRFAYRINGQFFDIAFLLSLIDSIEYIDRPLFSDFHLFKETTKIRDINLDLKLIVNYSINRCLHLKIKIDYNDIYTPVDVLKIATMIREQISRFISKRWGITVILTSSVGGEMEFPLLRREEDLFKQYYKNKNGKELRFEINEEKILQTYKQFLEDQLEALSSIEQERSEEWITRINPQIYKLTQEKK